METKRKIKGKKVALRKIETADKMKQKETPSKMGTKEKLQAK